MEIICVQFNNKSKRNLTKKNENENVKTKHENK